MQTHRYDCHPRLSPTDTRTRYEPLDARDREPTSVCNSGRLGLSAHNPSEAGNGRGTPNTERTGATHPVSCQLNAWLTRSATSPSPIIRPRRTRSHESTQGPTRFTRGLNRGHEPPSQDPADERGNRVRGASLQSTARCTMPRGWPRRAVATLYLVPPEQWEDHQTLPIHNTSLVHAEVNDLGMRATPTRRLSGLQPNTLGKCRPLNAFALRSFGPNAAREVNRRGSLRAR